MPTPAGPAALIHIAAYLLVILIAGYTAVSAVVRTATRHWAELAGLSFAAGAGLASLWLMLASLAGFSPSRNVLAAGAAAVAVATGAVLWRRGQLLLPTVPARARPDAGSLVGGLAAIALLAAIGNVWAETTAPGLADIDEYATWMLKAKVLVAAPLYPIPPALTDPGYSYSHQDYPLLLPLLASGAYAAVGRVDESAAKLVLLPMYLSLVGILYGAARRQNRRAAAVAITALAAAAPVVVSKAGLLVGELPVTLYLAAAVSMLARWAQRQERADLLLAGGFAAAAAFSKNEGLAVLPVFAVAATALAVCRTHKRQRLATDPLLATTASLALLSPWLIYRHWLPRTHEDYGGKLVSATVVLHGLGRLPHTLWSMLGAMVDFTSAGALWIALPVVAILGHRALATGAARLVWAVLLAQLGLYVAAFLVTPWDLDTLLNMVTPKLLAQASPAAAVLIALHLPAAGSQPAQVKSHAA